MRRPAGPEGAGLGERVRMGERGGTSRVWLRDNGGRINKKVGALERTDG